MIRFIPKEHNAHKLSDKLKALIIQAQENAFEKSFSDANVFLRHIFDQLRMQLTAPEDLKSVTAIEFTDKSYGDLTRYFVSVLIAEGYPNQAIPRASAALASRALLLRAFSDPDAAVTFVRDKVMAVVSSFPKTSADIEVGRNKGDVLDPFILAATQYLLYQGEFEGAVSATVSHKALMIIEGLMGHLHEDVLGLMRGNVRVPEPRGEDQESFDHINNPFPGADLIQPPTSEAGKFKIHQIKSKTGSAKGGDGKRLGDQLLFLSQHYDADVFYDALVGNTLIGHRSKKGVEKAAPMVRVLVGKAAFLHLTGSGHGASLLLRLYQEAFLAVAKESGYSINEVTETIVESFRARATELGEDFLDSILETSTGGNLRDQDSVLFNRR